MSEREISQLLGRWSQGDREALQDLVPLVLQELRALGRTHLRRAGRRLPLRTATLIQELYLRLEKQEVVSFDCRAQFFAFAGRLMRRAIVDHARVMDAAKRGGGLQRVSLEEARDSPEERLAEFQALDDALRGLHDLDGRQYRVVELYFFGGYTYAEISTKLDISVATVRRDWETARAFLLRELTRRRGLQDVPAKGSAT